MIRVSIFMAFFLPCFRYQNVKRNEEKRFVELFGAFSVPRRLFFLFFLSHDRRFIYFFWSSFLFYIVCRFLFINSVDTSDTAILSEGDPLCFSFSRCGSLIVYERLSLSPLSCSEAQRTAPFSA